MGYQLRARPVLPTMGTASDARRREVTRSWAAGRGRGIDVPRPHRRSLESAEEGVGIRLPGDKFREQRAQDGIAEAVADHNDRARCVVVAADHLRCLDIARRRLPYVFGHHRRAARPGYDGVDLPLPGRRCLRGISGPCRVNSYPVLLAAQSETPSSRRVPVWCESRVSPLPQALTTTAS